MELSFKWFILSILCLQYILIQGKTFFVSDYGAYPKDEIDDANSIQFAIDLAINYGMNSSVIFGYGTCYLSSTLMILNSTNLTITGQGINQTLLVGTAPISIFSAKYSNGSKITSLSMISIPYRLLLVMLSM